MILPFNDERFQLDDPRTKLDPNTPCGEYEVDAKRKAAGTPQETERAVECSRVIMTEHAAWCDRVKAELGQMTQGSKTWWAKERQLQLQKQKMCSIPALKGAGGEWVLNAEGKANLFAKSFGDKYSLSGFWSSSRVILLHLQSLMSCWLFQKKS